MHPFVLAMRLLPFLFLFFIPSLLSGFLSAFGAFNSLSIPSHLSRFFTGLWDLGTWIGAFTVFTQYYLTVWIITNLRIVDIRQRGFFNRSVSSFMLTRIQDVTTDVSGVLATLFHFGRLEVETAGQDEHFVMNGIAHPEDIRDTIMRQAAIAHGQNPTDTGL